MCIRDRVMSPTSYQTAPPRDIYFVLSAVLADCLSIIPQGRADVKYFFDLFFLLFPNHEPCAGGGCDHHHRPCTGKGNDDLLQAIHKVLPASGKGADKAAAKPSLGGE